MATLKTKIKNTYPHHDIVGYEQDIHIADYTEKTKKESIKRTVEIHKAAPLDIESFHLKNPGSTAIETITFDNKSFTNQDGNTKSQCECIVFPHNSSITSWILFLELKYCLLKNIMKKLDQAQKQLQDTCSYLRDTQILHSKQTKYLIASMPEHTPPFESFIFSGSDLQDLKKQDKIILRRANTATIKSTDKLLV